MKKLILVACAFLISVPSLLTHESCAKDLPLPQVETFANGLQVAWFIQDRFPVVDMIYYFPVGYRHDPAGKSGTVELLSELLEKGAGGKSAKQISDAIESLGASRYVNAGEDHFSIGVHGLSVDSATLFSQLTDIAWKPDFPAEEFQKEKTRLLERWSHLGDYAETLAGLLLHRRLAAGTPYSRGSFLSESEFKSVTIDDVRNFYRSAFRPDGAILMLIGRINRDELRPKIEALFGGTAPTVAATPSKMEPLKSILTRDPRLKTIQESDIVVVDRPGVNQAQVRMGFNSLPVNAPERYALAVGNTAFGETFNSRLNTVIRDQLGLTYSISSSFTYAKDLASYTVSSFTRTETVGQMIVKVNELLSAAGRGDFQPIEISKAKDVMIGGYPIATATLSAIASRWLGGVTYGFSPGYLNEFIPKVSAVQLDDVKKAFQKAFAGKKMQIVIAGEYQAIQKSLKAAGLKNIKKLSVADLR